MRRKKILKRKKKLLIPAAEGGIKITNQELHNERMKITNDEIKEIGKSGLPLKPIAPKPEFPPVDEQTGEHVDTSTAMGIANAAISGASMVTSSIFQKSTATTGKEAASLSVNDVLNGAGTGMQLGAQIGGPMGAGIGAAAGAVLGSIGHAGEKAKMTSFTDYDEGTLGTGLIGAFSNKKLRRERARIKQNAYNNKAAVQGTNYLQNEYLQEHGGMNTSTFAEGGQIPTSLVYVDDGEMIRTPQGDMLEVPENGRPTDSNLVNLPVGSEILSDSLRVPGTKKTFAQLEKEMISKRQSKGNDRFAENSKMLNERNNKSIHEQLFALQEYVKQQRGIKPKTKGLDILAAEGGLKTGNNSYTKWAKKPNPEEFKYWANSQEISENEDPTKLKSWKYKNGLGVTPLKGTLKLYNRGYIDYVNANVDDAMIDRILKGEFGDMSNFLKKNKGYKPTRDEAIKWMTDGSYSDWHKAAQAMYEASFGQEEVEDIDEINANAAIPTPEVILDEEDLNYRPSVGFDMEGLNKRIREINRKAKWQKVKDTLPALGDTLSRLGELTPAIMNLLTETPEGVQANYNPYATAITNTMGNRRYNIEKERQEILRNRAIGNRNISQMNTNTGANLAYALNSAIQTDKNIAEAYRYADNVNAQYAGEYANMMNNLGQQWTAETNRVQEANAANRATARNIRRQGASQISQWLQRNRMEKNLSNKDKAMLALYRSFLDAGTPTSDVNEFYKGVGYNK